MNSHSYKMVELVHVKMVLRVILFTCLLIVYSVMYMEPALKQYAKKSKTIAQKREIIQQPESPVLVFCPDPPFKKSFFDQFGKNKTLGMDKYFWAWNWQMLENSPSTANDIYMNMSYQLGIDWNISLPNFFKYVLFSICFSLKLGKMKYYDRKLNLIFAYQD